MTSGGTVTVSLFRTFVSRDFAELYGHCLFKSSRCIRIVFYSTSSPKIHSRFFSNYMVILQISDPLLRQGLPDIPWQFPACGLDSKWVEISLLQTFQVLR